MQWTQTRSLSVRSRQWASVSTEIRGFPLPSLYLSASPVVGEFFGKISGIFFRKNSEMLFLRKTYNTRALKSFSQHPTSRSSPIVVWIMCGDVRHHGTSTSIWQVEFNAFYRLTLPMFHLYGGRGQLRPDALERKRINIRWQSRFTRIADDSFTPAEFRSANKAYICSYSIHFWP